MSKKIGFIGGGNMAGALIRGLLAKGKNASDIYLYEISEEKAQAFSKIGVGLCKSAAELADCCDAVVLAVKPNVFPTVLKSLNGKTNPLYLSIGAGVSISFLEEGIGSGARVVRIMPNMPAMAGEGMSVLSYGAVTVEDKAVAREIFSCVGLVEELPESMMDGVVALSGSGPAYFYMMIEAMADAGVAEGLPRDVAYRLAAQTAVGAGKTSLTELPSRLKDMVCSPGGTTIEAVAALEQNGFRNAVMKAVKACADKNRKMRQ